MATQSFVALTAKGEHEVGNLVSSHFYIQDFPNGALFVEDVDNFTLVEAELNAENGEMEAKALTDVTKENQFLVAAVERCFLGETMAHFFVGEGERGRIVYLHKGLMFDTSAFELKDVEEAKVGMKAYFDVAKKKFIIDEVGNADAFVKFAVRRVEADTMYALGKPMVRLVVE